jgi:transcriptional regulator of arginine metabolism
MTKPARLQAILEIVETHQVASQEDLRRLLGARGHQVTQATLSRDLRELGVVRTHGEGGLRYALPGTLVDEAKPSLDALLPQLFARLDWTRELLVLQTLPGGAQPIAEGIDAQGWPEVVGTLGGENTILIICRTEEARADVASRLRRLAQAV